jgi:hypothetical protein
MPIARKSILLETPPHIHLPAQPRSTGLPSSEAGLIGGSAAVKRISLVVFLAALGCLLACSSYNAPASTTTSPAGITVTVSPATVSLNILTPQAFQASVSGGTNLVVIWQVNGKTGGDDTVGKIDSNGHYLSPSAVPSGGTVTVTAVSFEDKTASGSATVTILAPPVVSVSPASASVVSAGQTNFTSTVTGAPTTNVIWEVNNIVGGNSTFGTIDPTGLFTAPLAPPLGGTVTVTAVSADYPHPPSQASATVTISGFAAASFQGFYAFSLAGQNTAGPIFRAGSFKADGAGQITSGVEDIRDASSATAHPLAFTGTYTLTPDGRGTMHFNDGHTPADFAIALMNNSQVQITGFDASGTSIGQASLQDLTAFKLSAFFGTYVFDFNGLDASSKPLSQIGEFTADGSAGITNGFLDANDNGVVSATPASFTGSFQADPANASTLSSNGRLLATLHFPGGDRSFALYMVSRGTAKFVELDTAQVTAGVATQQAPNQTFSVASLTGNFVLQLSGSGAAGAIATAGSFSADGGGHVTTGVLDENTNGAVTQAAAFSAGASYTIDPVIQGRGTVTFTTSSRAYKLVLYLGQAGGAVIQETDSSITSDGTLVQQQLGANPALSTQSSFAFAATGLSGASPQTLAGQLTANGAGAISSGHSEINTAGTLASAEAVTGSYTAASSAGRVVLTLNPTADNRNFALYVINPTQAFLIGSDSGRLAAGSLFRQF